MLIKGYQVNYIHHVHWRINNQVVVVVVHLNIRDKTDLPYLQKWEQLFINIVAESFKLSNATVATFNYLRTINSVLKMGLRYSNQSGSL